MTVREVTEQDLPQLLELYLYLHETEIPDFDEHLLGVWQKILSDPDHHIIVAEEDGKLVSTCVCVILPNLTRGVRPYALVENVVTHGDYRGKGYASACLAYAKELALKENCYRLTLATGSKLDSTLNFYRHAGYSSEDKTAFNQWL